MEISHIVVRDQLQSVPDLGLNSELGSFANYVDSLLSAPAADIFISFRPRDFIDLHS